MKNKYANRSKISEAKTRQLIRLFSLDLDAGQIAAITGLNRNTVNRYLVASPNSASRYPRSAAKWKWTKATSAASEVGGAGGKVIVFGLFRRNGKVSTQIVPDVKAKIL